MVRGTLLRGGLEQSGLGQAACVSSEKLDSFSDSKPGRQDFSLLIEQQEGQNGWNTLEEGKENRK